jgi:hypothetical protein
MKPAEHTKRRELVTPEEHGDVCGSNWSDSNIRWIDA